MSKKDDSILRNAEEDVFFLGWSDEPAFPDYEIKLLRVKGLLLEEHSGVMTWDISDTSPDLLPCGESRIELLLFVDDKPIHSVYMTEDTFDDLVETIDDFKKKRSD